MNSILVLILIFLTSCLGGNKSVLDKHNNTIPNNKVDSLAASYKMQAKQKSTQGDKQGAIEYYNKAIEVKPEYDSAYYSRGVVKSYLGLYDESIKDYTKAIELNSNYLEAYYNRGNAKSRLGDKKGAIKDYNNVIALNKNDPEAYYSRANAKSAMGDKKGALADYSKAIELKPDYKSAYLNRALTKLKMGDREGEIADYRLAVKNCIPNADLYNNLGLALYEQKRFKESAEAYGEGIVHFPKDCKLYYGRGLARNQSGDKKGACEDWKKSSALGCFEANALLPLCKDCETEK